MQRARDILPPVYREGAKRSDPDASLALSYWGPAAGEALARVSRAVRFEKGALLVEVAGGEWRKQLGAVEGRIREKLNRALGGPVVRRIRFRVAEFPTPIAAAPKPVRSEADGVLDPMRRRIYLAEKRAAARRAAKAEGTEPR